MNKKRIFPFGYRMTEGQIDLNAEEAEVIRFIFQKYSEGLSVPKLTERIQAFNVPYRDGSRWNKNMVCRILDNKIYLGNGEYPPIIEKCLFDKVLSQRSVIRSGRLNPIIKAVREKLCCPECGQKLIRSTHHSGKNMIWTCPKCEIETGVLPDGELLERIIAKLNYVIDHSAQATQSAKSAECLSLEAMRLTNELNRKMNDPNISSDYLLKLIKRCAQEKYNALQNQSVGWQNELLKKELESRSPSESLDVQLFQKAVYKVLIAYDTTVTLQLVNRKIF